MSKMSLTLHDLSVDVAAQILAMLGETDAARSGTGDKWKTGQILAMLGGTDAADDTPPALGANIPAVDSTGLPWDERIHAKTKTQSTDGKWKKARNVTEEFVRTVELELRAQAAPPVPRQPVFPPQGQPAAPTYGNPLPTVAQPPAAYPAAQPATEQPPPPVPSGIPPAPIPTPQQPTTPMNEFQTLMSGIARGLSAGTFDQPGIAAWVGVVNTSWGTTYQNVTELKDRADIAGWLMQAMQNANVWPAG